jgi:hypothetical protein
MFISRYRNVDDDECMESNFAQQQREEFVSAKLGMYCVKFTDSVIISAGVPYFLSQYSLSLSLSPFFFFFFFLFLVFFDGHLFFLQPRLRLIWAASFYGRKTTIVDHFRVYKKLT